jgi:hypothetical protein
VGNGLRRQPTASGAHEATGLNAATGKRNPGRRKSFMGIKTYQAHKKQQTHVYNPSNASPTTGLL